MAGKKITLPSGAWVQLRDTDTIKNRDRRELMRKIDGLDSDLEKGFATEDTFIALMVDSWSFDFPLPKEDASSLDELSISDFDALTDAMKDVERALFPNFEPDPDPKARTPKSSASKGR